LKTGSVTIAYQDVAMKTKLEIHPKLKQSTAVELLDVSQGISAEMPKDRTYDVILTSGLSSNAPKQDMTAETITRLLKKGGKMCILEAGNLTDKTQDLLRKAHMETMVIHNVEETQSQQLNLVIAKKIEVSHVNGTTDTSRHEHVTLIQMADPSEAAQAMASDLATSLERSGYTVIPFIWGSDMSHLSGKSCISLVEFETPLLRDLTDKDFASVQQLVLGATNILWVVGFDDPSAAMVDGLARTVRNETPGLSFRTFHAEEQYSSSAASLGDLIGRVFSSTTEDDEFLVKGHLLHVSRIEEDEALNEQINDILPGAQERISSMPLGQVQYPTKLCIRNPGMLDSLCLEPDDLPRTELEDDFIEIQVKATALK
jgi:hypothetical protein